MTGLRNWPQLYARFRRCARLNTLAWELRAGRGMARVFISHGSKDAEEAKRLRAWLRAPAWCIEMEKWPYDAKVWKDWLTFRRANADPPLPGTPEWGAVGRKIKTRYCRASSDIPKAGLSRSTATHGNTIQSITAVQQGRATLAQRPPVT
jgi:hypothetical protein